MAVSRELSGNEVDEVINMGTWDDEYEKSVPCAGIPTYCDNLTKRVANFFNIQPNKARKIIADVESRYGAVRTVDEFIQEAITEKKKACKI